MKTRTIDDIFNDALERTPEERESYLNVVCAGQHELRFEVESLLSAYERSGEFISSPPPTSMPPIESALMSVDGDRMETGRNLIGQRIGRYRIVDIIAIGGMGTVFRGVREQGEFQQHVAIKLIHPDIATAGMIRRFQSERQALACLEHPGITRLIDGDRTADGLPYLVMELVDGASINDYCRTRRLSVESRLRLFLKACDAVAFAHRHLVIHRDLKPANVLVTSRGELKLCDFGIASLLNDADGGAERGETLGILRMLTPQYASPEQISGGRITTATDVYSLGVILFELLTGQPMREKCDLAADKRPEPIRPSSRLSVTGAGRQKEVASEFGMTTTGLRRLLRGDLDTIVMKALRHDPEERYPSVERLAEDIQRHLSGRPVLARPQTSSYRLKKFVRRHRAGIAAGAVAVLSLVATVILSGHSLMQARQAEATAVREREQAEAARSRALRVGTVLKETLAGVNPLRNGGDITILDLLADARSRADALAESDPDVAAELYLTLGKTYGKIWQWDEAADCLGIALDLNRRLLPHECEEVADVLTWYGRALTFLRDPRAIEIQREGLAIRLKLHPENDPRVAESEGCLGYALWHSVADPDHEAAALRYRRSLAAYRAAPSAPRFDHARMAMSFGVLLRGMDRREESEAHFKEALAIYRAGDDRDDRYMLACIEQYSIALELWGRLDEALTLANEAEQMMPPGLDEQWRTRILHRRAGILQRLGRDADSPVEQQATGPTRAEAMAHLDQPD